MSEAKHTPGPWEVIGPDDQAYGDIIIRAGGRRIARLWQDDAPVPEFNSEQWANARIQAAAPDLYDALREIQRLCADIPLVERNPRFAEARRAALAALAKAEGRS
jgi:hypothetical protein